MGQSGMNPREKAEALAAEAFPIPWNDARVMHVNRQNFVDAYLAGRLEGIRESAEVAAIESNNYRERWIRAPAENVPSQNMEFAADRIAKAIRKLAEGE